MHSFKAESAAETGLKCICVHIYPALDSSCSEDSQLGPVGGMSSDQSEHFPSRTHVYIINNTMTETRSSRIDFQLIDFVPVLCKRSLIQKLVMTAFQQGKLFVCKGRFPLHHFAAAGEKF